MKITTSDNVVATTASAISRVPANAASNAEHDRSSITRWMFSSTTIASSITTPTAKVSPSIVELFSVNPIHFISVKVATMLTGMAMLAMSVPRQSCRKKKTVNATSTMPSTRWNETSSRLRRMNLDWSRTMSSRTSGGSVARSCSRRSFSAAMSFTELEPLCLRMTSVTAFSPSSRASVRGSSTPSVTVATWPSRIGWPPLFATIRRSNSATLSSRPSVRRTSSRAPCSTRPPGTSMFCAASAARTSSTVRLKARSRSMSTATWIARARAPMRLMAPTSGTVSRFCLSCLSAR